MAEPSARYDVYETKCQTIYHGLGSHEILADILEANHIRKVLLVCDGAFPYLEIGKYFSTLSVPIVVFNGFSSNPRYDSVREGVELLNAEQCDWIVAVGGGSSLDVAKCIKLFGRMDPGMNFMSQEYRDNDIHLVAIPTTSGTGSESTRYAVIYFDGEKQSITHDSIIPEYAILDSISLRTLPLYQKKCTMLDALCQGIESWWSINSTRESIDYSKQAIDLIVSHMESYLANEDDGNDRMLLGSNYAGRAICITQTTAPHAMSYKLTSMFGLPHGHAVAICLPRVWRYMVSHLDRCKDPRGAEYLRNVFENISIAFAGSPDVENAINVFSELLRKLGIDSPENVSNAQITLLADSVNPVRLKNNPVSLSEEVLLRMYNSIAQNNRWD